MLRRCVPMLYRYQEFEMHNISDLPFYYPREAPNTSVFPQFQINLWMDWGYSREEVWIDKDTRRYDTTWQMFRRLIMWIFPTFFVFPIGLPYLICSNMYGEYGERPFLADSNKRPFDNLYIENGGQALDPEWVRHIHSKESY